jgi:pathogenesis-related protein 1
MKAALKAVFLIAATCLAQPSIETATLAAHNAVRAPLGVPPLKWSARLADQAQGWANRLLSSDRFAHHPAPVYGENLFEVVGAHASPEQVVEAWTAESRDYDYATNKCRKVCGHYTQLVWAATKSVGCGVARNSHREVWVCNYDPPGNYIGRRPY